MFVHSGAGLHGHEYKDQRPSPNQPAHRPLLRSALRTWSATNTDMKHSTVSHELHDGPDVQSQPHIRHSLPPSHPRSQSDGTHKKDLAVRFSEPQMDYMRAQLPRLPSDDEASVAESDFSDYSRTSSALRRRSKRAARQATRFALAQPAPQLRTKQRNFVQVRPRLLLQLQELGEKRATPAYDVIPSSLLAGSLILPYLAKSIPWALGAKKDLGQNDMLIARSEDYDPPDILGKPLKKKATPRDIVGVVSATGKPDTNRFEIALDDGSAWQTSDMANGSFEFTCVADDGAVTVARWVKRTPRTSMGDTASKVEDRWTFSMIDPSTKRHPIMGTLTPTTLELFDSYSTMSASSGRFPPTRSFSPDTAGAGEPMPSPALSADERTSVPVSEENKRLMTVTAIWVSLRCQGWPASSNPKLARAMAQCRSPSSDQRERSNTFPRDGRKEAASSRDSTPSPRVSGGARETSSARTSQEASRKRATSAGALYMASRQNASKTRSQAEASKKLEQGNAPGGQYQDSKGGQQPRSCRLSFRHWLQRLFTRKS